MWLGWDKRRSLANARSARNVTASSECPELAAHAGEGWNTNSRVVAPDNRNTPLPTEKGKLSKGTNLPRIWNGTAHWFGRE